MSEALPVVLYAEDSDDDAFLMQRAFAKAKFPAILTVVPNGLEALNYLAGQGDYADRRAHPSPCLVLLDIKMPHRNGLEVLQWIRARPEFSTIPVVMLTSSSQPPDITRAYHAGADCYVVKPTSLDTFGEFVSDLRPLCAGARTSAGWLKVRGCVPPPTSPPL
jgi:CheY-like chemotaxis protein